MFSRADRSDYIVGHRPGLSTTAIQRARLGVSHCPPETRFIGLNEGCQQKADQANRLYRLIIESAEKIIKIFSRPRESEREKQINKLKFGAITSKQKMEDGREEAKDRKQRDGRIASATSY